MQDEYGETALFAACSQGRYDPAALLINHGADVNYLGKVRLLHVYGQHGRMVCKQGGASLHSCVHGHHSVWILYACRNSLWAQSLLESGILK